MALVGKALQGAEDGDVGAGGDGVGMAGEGDFVGEFDGSGGIDCGEEGGAVDGGA